MSRIGKKPVPVGAAKVTRAGSSREVRRPQGQARTDRHPAITVKLDAAKKELVVTRPDDETPEQGAARPDPLASVATWSRASREGYKKSLEIQGVGYKAEQKGKNLVLSVGYANTITLAIPAGLTVRARRRQKIHVSGPDKQVVGQFASEVRRVRKPEPYKGKGIRYKAKWSRSSRARRLPVPVRSK